ncbi:glycosyltransferase family 2 protein [Lacticaseibacillus saniviri]|uniref:Glycosyltransferase, group 2 family protein n=2 Tax=Lacticaseibacillus saniviri TaxID=931533 RepID=A0A0R2MN99_9LACO|nr:glycosyltransferase family 2 protein [Lacticaseibacillus saniviri]KRO15185.1 glycosyltransferase, group 2 family protein [Lacticaseibacillus saniviri JCM 17471 = DSM 24301]MCG4281830.1 glycosyltransferase [Lacticaseibacillus saniviri]
MAETPLITVVVPTYNLGHYFDDSLASIQAQTYANYEVYLIDDASTDGTAKRVDAAASDERYHVIHFDTHRGVSVARNYGLDRAKGEFVTFVDGDDQLEPDFLSTIADGIAQGPADVITVGYNWGRWFESARAHGNGWQRVSKRAMFDAVRARGDAIGGYVWNKAFRVALLRENKIRYDESLALAEDLLFTTEAVVASDNFWFNPAVMYQKINRPGSTIHSATGEMRRTEQQVRRHMDELGRGL